MLFLLGDYLQQFYGPFRLLSSHFFLAGVALVVTWVASWVLLPVLAPHLPRDRGRAFSVEAEAAIGKPTGAGIVFVIIFCVVGLMVVPLSGAYLGVLACILLAMFTGYLDDRSPQPWSEYVKGALDLVVSALAALILCGFQPNDIWLPFTNQIISISPAICVPVATGIIWITVNATNCTDGVDGLSGTLSILALVSLAALLYFVLGREDISTYLLLPHYVDGAKWAIMAFAMVGCLAGYLWYNAHPSELLMGDAGSRAIGLLMGVLVIKTGNPFVIFIVSGVLLVNGGTGLLKVALLRFLRIRIFHSIRFPLHDQVRHRAGWSNTQVLVRFALLQVMVTLVFLVAFIKIR